jgi:hypothetical protein
MKPFTFKEKGTSPLRAVWLVLAIGCLTLTSVNAATITATNGLEVGVNAAISSSSPGDTVVIPAGTWTWFVGGVNFSGITISGQGTNQTIIVDNVPDNNGSSYVFYATPPTNGFSRLTSLTIADRGAGAQSYKGKVVVDNRAYGGLATWRIDSLVCSNLNGMNLFPYGNNGLIDHCVFYLRGEAVAHYGTSLNPANPFNTSDLLNDPWGDAPYAATPAYGSTNALYIESCWFTNISGPSQAQPAYDGYAGAASVFRYNYLGNCAWYNHGNDTSGRYRSTRRWEIYQNTFFCNISWVSAMDFRGGTGVIFSNTVSGFVLFNTTENYRNVQGNVPFGGVDGTNPWDNTNGVVYFSGTNTVTATVVTCAGANWTANQWAGYTVYDPGAGTVDIGHGTGSVKFCLIQGNTSNTLTMTPPKDFQIVFTNGDAVSIYRVTNCLDQVGRGSGDRLRTVTVGQFPNSVDYTFNIVTGTNSWPRQVVEPLYSWGNIMSGTNVEARSTYPSIVVGKDILQNTVRPAYSPLAYPHPLIPAAPTNSAIGFTFGAFRL